MSKKIKKICKHEFQELTRDSRSDSFGVYSRELEECKRCGLRRVTETESMRTQDGYGMPTIHKTQKQELVNEQNKSIQRNTK